MRSILLLIVMAVSLCVTSCRRGKGNGHVSDLETHVDSLFQSSIANAEIAGGTVLVFQQDSTLLKKLYGMASLELSVPMPEDAQFEIGSVTKQFTAAAILKLVEDGALALEDDFTEYLPYDTKGRKVTINNLLNHTSGIPSYTEIPEFWELAIEDRPRDTLVRIVEQHDFLFEPNEASIYNNSAYFFLGLIIEQVTGQSYEDYLRQEFFVPLGMHHTQYCSNSEVVKNKVYGYEHAADGLRQKGYLNQKWPYSGGSLCSTAEDLRKWLTALHGGKVLSEESYRSMITPDTLSNGARLNYAMGLVNFQNYGHHEISHSGYINGFLSDTRFYPDDDLYIICLLNTTGPKGAGFFANGAIWNLLDKKEYPKRELDIDVAEIVGHYSGVMRNGTRRLEVKSIEDAITVREEGNKHVDTLKVYVGNNSWMVGNNKVTIKDNAYHINSNYNYYILKKESDAQSVN